MKCEICHQNEAETVLYRPSKDGGRPEELYVCKACAKRERVFDQERGIQVAAVDSDRIADMPETGLPPGPNPGLPPGFDQLKMPKEVMGQLGEVFNELSKRMRNADASNGDDSEEEDSEARCPRCGMPADELRHHALAGCPDCYKAHRKLITSLLEQIQQTSEFHGNPFPGTERAQAIEALKAQQREAIEEEDYRQAKQLGEQLSALANSSDEAHAKIPKSIDDIDDFDPDNPEDDEILDGPDDDDTPQVHSPEEAAEVLKRAINRALADGHEELAARLCVMLEMVKQQKHFMPDDETPAKGTKKAEKKPAKAAKKPTKATKKSTKKPTKKDGEAGK